MNSYVSKLETTTVDSNSTGRTPSDIHSFKSGSNFWYTADYYSYIIVKKRQQQQVTTTWYRILGIFTQIHIIFHFYDDLQCTAFILYTAIQSADDDEITSLIFVFLFFRKHLIKNSRDLLESERDVCLPS
jgi:hypothetical protein